MHFQKWLKNKSDKQILPFLMKLKALKVDALEIQKYTKYSIWSILSILCQIIMVGINMCINNVFREKKIVKRRDLLQSLNGHKKWKQSGKKFGKHTQKNLQK